MCSNRAVNENILSVPQRLITAFLELENSQCCVHARWRSDLRKSIHWSQQITGFLPQLYKRSFCFPAKLIWATLDKSAISDYQARTTAACKGRFQFPWIFPMNFNCPYYLNHIALSSDFLGCTWEVHELLYKTILALMLKDGGSCPSSAIYYHDGELSH